MANDYTVREGQLVRRNTTSFNEGRVPFRLDRPIGEPAGDSGPLKQGITIFGETIDPRKDEDLRAIELFAKSPVAQEIRAEQLKKDEELRVERKREERGAELERIIGNARNQATITDDPTEASRLIQDAILQARGQGLISDAAATARFQAEQNTLSAIQEARTKAIEGEQARQAELVKNAREDARRAELDALEREKLQSAERRASVGSAPVGQAAEQAVAKIEGRGQQLTPEIAQRLVDEAGGDKNRARQLARERGFVF